MLFTFDGWWQDMPCSFKGPSSLYQRWNLQLRFNYGFLKPYYDSIHADMRCNQSGSAAPPYHNITNMNTDHVMQVLLVVRKGASGDGTVRTSRFFLNTDDIIASLKTISGIVFLPVDLSVLSFEAQLEVIGNSSIVIGMHGAGVTHSMHMAIGTKYCCGVVEIFPPGEYAPIRGHGNMARRMGHYYSRLDLANRPTDRGSFVPPDQLKSTVENIIGSILQQPTCVLPSVLTDPFFEHG